ncbi:MAG: DinB family protein [Chitinophagaceae bacterium]|nr:DinB family protein [Chitinophagales bacterium]MDX1956629.1 DinB family protein [Chitinophagaceae bacterium]
MNRIILLLLFILADITSFAQVQKPWTEADRLFLVSGLTRTRNEVIQATQNLSDTQWHFKPDSASWSLAQVLEHLGLYERLFIQEADIMLSTVPDPAMDSLSLPDTTYINWMNDPNPHVADWNAIPLGFMKGKDNLRFFLFGRDRFINFVEKTTYDLRSHFTFRWGQEKRRSIHALIVVHFAHTDRHLKQIHRIMAHAGFPKK